jgi:hypothetical protein
LWCLTSTAAGVKVMTNIWRGDVSKFGDAECII